MAVAVSTIKAEVRKYLDEIGVNESVFVGTSDGANLDSVIESRIEGAVNYVHQNAVLSDMALGSDLLVDQVSSTLITDYLRLVRVNNTDWSHSVTDVIKPGDPAWAIANDPNCGATNDRPMVRMEVTASGIKFDALPSPSNTQVDYIKRVAITSDSIVIDSNMLPAVYYQIAGEVLSVYGDGRAKTLFDLARQKMGLV